MARKKVIIVLGLDGSMHVDLQGYQGKECDQEKLLEALQGLLVGKPAPVKKPEYHRQVRQQVQQGG